MKKIKSLYLCGLVLVVCIATSLLYNTKHKTHQDENHLIETNFGNFLAAQHAIYVNDFSGAESLIKDLKDTNENIKNIKMLTSFVSGKNFSGFADLKKDKHVSSRLMYDAFLVKENKWSELYDRHKKDDSSFTASLRIFSGIKAGKKKEVLKFVDSLQTSDSWKAFIYGQIAILENDVDKAAKEFAKVHPNFMNVNDYFYLMSFYKEYGLEEDMKILRNDFVAKPGSMFVLNCENIPEWKNFSGYENALAFSVVQTISHTKIMLYTDLSLLLLRFAQTISDGIGEDVINYYLGQYFFYNKGNFAYYLNKINESHPLYLFGQVKIAESNKDMDQLANIASKNPLFTPAENQLINYYIQKGKKRSALKLVNKALNNKNISEDAKVYFLKQRANIYLMFGDLKKAQQDIHDASVNDMIDGDIISMQSRIWALENRNLDDAYDYAMSLVKKNPSNIIGWNAVGTVVALRESIPAALDVLEHVAAVSRSTSCIFETLGDLYIKQGDNEKAKNAYLRAIDLSDDGLVVVPYVEKKIRKIK